MLGIGALGQLALGQFPRLFVFVYLDVPTPRIVYATLEDREAAEALESRLVAAALENRVVIVAAENRVVIVPAEQRIVYATLEDREAEAYEN